MHHAVDQLLTMARLSVLKPLHKGVCSGKPPPRLHLHHQIRSDQLPTLVIDLNANAGPFMPLRRLLRRNDLHRASDV